MRFHYAAATLFAFTILVPRVSAAQSTRNQNTPNTQYRGSVDLVSGFSLNQGTSLIGGASSFSSGMNFAGRVAFDVIPSFQVVGEVGRIGNVLPTYTAAVLSFSPYDIQASALYGEGGVRAILSPRSAISPYVESTLGVARMNLRVGGISATETDLLNLGLGLVSRTSPLASVGGGIMMRSGRMTFDVGYRYKKIFAQDLVSTLIGAGQSLNSQQVAFGVGFRF
jgi:opacity protein-like surface antigen